MELNLLYRNFHISWLRRFFYTIRALLFQAHSNHCHIYINSELIEDFYIERKKNTHKQIQSFQNVMSCAVHVQNITISMIFWKSFFIFRNDADRYVHTQHYIHHRNHKSKNQFDSFREEFKNRDFQKERERKTTNKAKKTHHTHIRTHNSLEISQSKWLKCFQFVRSIEKSYVICVSIIETFFLPKE